MVFKSLVSYILGLVSGFVLFYFITAEQYITGGIFILITFTISQIISIKIKKRMKNRYRKKLRRNYSEKEYD